MGLSAGPGRLRRRVVAAAEAAAVAEVVALDTAAFGKAALCLAPPHAEHLRSVAVANVLAGHMVCPA